jgi:hypothetical protein
MVAHPEVGYLELGGRHRKPSQFPITAENGDIGK